MNSTKLAMLCGAGPFPAHLARLAMKKGLKLVAVGFEGRVEPELEGLVEKLKTFPFVKVEMLFNFLKDEAIEEVIMAGKIDKRWLYSDVEFDSLALELLKKLKDQRDDSIMQMIVEELSKRGLRVVESTVLTSDLFASDGVWTKLAPSENEWKDINFGFQMAKEIGRLDIGQTVVVRDQAIMAVEAVEGTDEAILRGGMLARKGAVVVKVAKPNQDLRFDVPVVGLNTLRSMKEACAKILALEANAVLVVDKEEMIKQADELNMCIVGVKPDGKTG